MEIQKRIKKIKKHFNNISIEQLEENLIKAGIKEIKPSDCEMIVFENGSKIIPVKHKEKVIRSKGYHIIID